MTHSNDEFLHEYAQCREIVNARLKECFLGRTVHTGLADAMSYSLLAGGKRIRPVLVMKFCAACGGKEMSVLPAACAVEMLHTYSLIHDDLPCMDNDVLRRGRPANHVIFGECTATLAGDCLQAEAFRMLLSSKLPAGRVVSMARALSDAAGLEGICGGQALDIDGEGKKLELPEIERIHRYKTAALLVACAKMGVYSAGGTDAQLGAAVKYAEDIGMAFQIRDDILDCTSSEEELGKSVGSDAENKKSTFVALYGLDECERLIRKKTESAISALSGFFDNGKFLAQLAEYLSERNA